MSSRRLGGVRICGGCPLGGWGGLGLWWMSSRRLGGVRICGGCPLGGWGGLGFVVDVLSAVGGGLGFVPPRPPIRRMRAVVVPGHAPQPTCLSAGSRHVLTHV